MTVGLNCTLRVTAWPGFSVLGKVVPDTEKPVPVTMTAVTFTAVVPVDVSVTDFVAAVFSFTVPNDSLEALMLSVEIAAFNCRATLFETPLADAVSVTD